jgi:lipopolysaccharide transport system ATP-binding protein
MGDIAIRVQNLSKQYRIGEAQPRYKTLRETLVSTSKRLLPSNPKRITQVPETTIWALNDVSFDIRQGEVVGIIGRNGAGKSTLLKVLAHITNPTKGRVEIHGRVGSLLEVGTGFHNELTGRENIYLNGAILGMKKVEIERKFDEIVAFAEIEKFLDTPVKHYSSGMYMRLAFAVAAHLEPEILLVDEVLAVGDAEFQKKCLGKMGDVVHEGRTVLFVSHNMAAVQKLCKTTILLGQGIIKQFCETNEATTTYLNENKSYNLVWERIVKTNSEAYFKYVYLCDENDQMVSVVTTGSMIKVVMEFTIKKIIKNLQVSIGLIDNFGEQIFGSTPQDWNISPPEEPGNYRAFVEFPPDIFMPKTYSIRTSLWTPEGGSLDSGDYLSFTASETASLANNNPGGRLGVIALRCKWTLEFQGSIR